MRTFYYLLLFVLTLTGCNRQTISGSTASRAPSPETTSLAPTAKDTALLWEISGPGVASPSYLFGTIHLIPEEDYFMPAPVVRALNDAAEVVFEIDPRDMQDPSAIFGLMDKLMMRGDTSIEDLLSAEEYATVEQYFTRQGLPFMVFKKMKPAFLSAMVGQDMSGAMSGGGLQGMRSYEFELTELAEGAGKDISGLETMAFQLGLFDAIPYRGQAEMLLKAVEADQDTAEGESPLDAIVKLYKRKAISEMDTMISDESAGTANFEEMLLTRRNANWAPRIKTMISRAEKTPLLFAVGAGHLGGEQGVIALLRRDGLTVTPVYQ